VGSRQPAGPPPPDEGADCGDAELFETGDDGAEGDREELGFGHVVIDTEDGEVVGNAQACAVRGLKNPFGGLVVATHQPDRFGQFLEDAAEREDQIHAGRGRQVVGAHDRGGPPQLPGALKESANPAGVEQAEAPARDEREAHEIALDQMFGADPPDALVIEVDVESAADDTAGGEIDDRGGARQRRPKRFREGSREHHGMGLGGGVAEDAPDRVPIPGLVDFGAQVDCVLACERGGNLLGAAIAAALEKEERGGGTGHGEETGSRQRKMRSNKVHFALPMPASPVFDTRMKPLPLALLLLCAVSASPLPAATMIVDWGGDYVSTSQNSPRRTSGSSSTGDFDGDTVEDDRRYLVAYSEVTALNPAIGASYNGTSAQFYGGIDNRAYNASVNLNLDDYNIEQGTADRINLRIQNSETGSTGGQTFGLYTWLQPDFLNGGNSGTWGLSSMSISVLDNAFTLRWLVKNNGQWYISQETESGASQTDVWESSGAQWSVYDPATSILFDDGSATFSDVSMSDVEGVGIYFQNLNTGTTAQRLRITDFQVEAIPEPSAVMFLGGFGLLALFRRRRA